MMKNQLMPMIDKILLRKRALIETVNDQLKNIAQIEHTRHRSIANFMVNLIAALVAYTHQPHKPSLRFSNHEVALGRFFYVDFVYLCGAGSNPVPGWVTTRSTRPIT